MIPVVAITSLGSEYALLVLSKTLEIRSIPAGTDASDRAKATTSTLTNEALSRPPPYYRRVIYYPK